MKRNASSTTSLTDMGVKSENSDDRLSIVETGEKGTLDYRLRYAMAEHEHRRDGRRMPFGLNDTFNRFL